MNHVKHALFGLILASFGIVGLAATSAPAHAEKQIIICQPEYSCVWASGCGTYMVCDDGSVWVRAN